MIQLEEKQIMVKKLKVESGYSPIDCKRALAKFNWNYHKAKKYLKDSSIKNMN